MKVEVEWAFKGPRIFETENFEELIKEIVRASDNSWAGAHTIGILIPGFVIWMIACLILTP